MSLLALAAGALLGCVAWATVIVQPGLHAIRHQLLALRRALVRAMQHARAPPDDARACEKLLEYNKLMQDALSKAQHFAASGDTDKARSHWQFADEVAVQGLALKVYGQERAVEAASSRHELHRMQARVRQRLAELKGPPAHASSKALVSARPAPAQQPMLRPRPQQPRATAPAQPRPAAASARPAASTVAAPRAMAASERPTTRWDDIIGLARVKQALHEAVVLPALRADLFQGIRAPVRGILLFGPPGTGKTLVAKAAAASAQCEFFEASAASLTSKWHGEGEKQVRELFQAARKAAPSLIFIDEIDALLATRSAIEHEASRRLKTEFLVQMDGVATGDTRVLVLAATNRPADLDDAVVRRLPTRIHVPLPEAEARRTMVTSHLRGVQTRLSERDMAWLAAHTERYSGSDLRALCHEAAMGPIRDLGPNIERVAASKLRPVALQDFQSALEAVRPSVGAGQVRELEAWARQFGARA